MQKGGQDLSFDFATCFGHERLPKALWKRYLPRARAVAGRIGEEVKQGQLGFWKLPDLYSGKNTLAPIKAAADNIIKSFDNLVVIGIGGSSLGARMLAGALLDRYHNERAPKQRKGVRLYFLENADPDSFDSLMSLLDIKRTMFNVISKSGSTAETASQFVLVRDMLQKALPKKWNKHLIFTTDPESGILRTLAEEDNVATLSVPQDVGGRYSVLSPVGLLPAMATGMDVTALLKGAKRMAKRCLTTTAEANPALSGALVHVLADFELNINMAVAFPYADALNDWTEWFAQLWAESLGKAQDETGRLVHIGTTPIKALGAIDQHSQVQLYAEGPKDKVFMFIRVERFNKSVKFPAKTRLPDALKYLGGHSLQELLLAEQTATRFALGEHNRMTYQVTMPKVSADTLGQLIFFAEAMTVYAGYLYGVNPFDQPGVELGKKFAYGLMGREGFEEFRKRISVANGS